MGCYVPKGRRELEKRSKAWQALLCMRMAASMAGNSPAGSLPSGQATFYSHAAIFLGEIDPWMRFFGSFLWSILCIFFHSPVPDRCIARAS